MKLPVMPPLEPMLAKPVSRIRPGWLYEPKWDGFRAIVFRDEDEVEIMSRNARPMARYFPEVVAAARRALPSRCVVDGEIIIADPELGALDFWALQQRLHPARSRVEMLAERTPARLVVFDLLALGDEDLTAQTFRRRRLGLERISSGFAESIHLTPITEDPATAQRRFEEFEGAGLDGVIAKNGEDHYVPGRRVMEKVKHERTADCVVVGYRRHKSGPDAVGSLLLALYSGDASADDEWSEMFRGLVPIGVASSFPMARRRQLVAELEPLIIDVTEHPWGDAMREMASETGASQGSRWNPEKDLSFVPLRPDLVAEVRYNHMDGRRLRHPAQFLRWRPDREPTSCDFDQLEVPAPVAVTDILGG
jgi:ATP-dependent DNA ligase